MSLPGSLRRIDVVEAQRRLADADDRAILLDVREVSEFTEVRAPGASLVPMSAFQQRMAELPTDRPIMVICHMGGRSAAVASFLARSGWTDVVDVAGGMDAWEQAGLPVRRGVPDPGEGDLR